ncbi:MAG: heme A synthase [Caulobacterales bacterium 32-67-6]|nr:MAG: heme A synthase [Caulobacterales bacterium 32-67-6]
MRWSYNLERSRAVAVWLFAVAAIILAIVVVGGATRLTGSGLSITEWRPVTGAIPPLSDQAWAAEFAKYQQIPQYRFINQGMSLAAFKGIYWWEWGHRFLARFVGVAFAVPFLIFLARRSIPRRLIWRCLVIMALGGLQALVGWWMVASGLSERVSVAPERLAVHLGLALIVLCACVWTGLEAWFGKARVGYSLDARWRLGAAVLAGLAFLQSLLGALVAGNDAGQVYNDWPLMNGRIIPDDYVAQGGGLAKTLLHSQGAVQFDHRIGAYVLFAGALAFALAVTRSRMPVPVKALGHLLAVLVFLQAALGVWTLMAHAPLVLSSLHQVGAVAVLVCAVVLAWRVRRPAN